MGKKEWITLAATALAVAALLMPSQAKTNYRTAKVMLRTVEETIEATGAVVPQSTFLASPLTAGRLRLLVHRGQKVEAGQVLFEIENAPEGLAADVRELLEKEKGGAAPTLSDLYEMNAVKSPISGSVQNVYAADSQTVTMGMPVASLCSERKVLRFTIPQSSREKIAIGQKIRARREGRRYGGTIEDIAPDENGQFLVTAALETNVQLPEGIRMDVSVLLGSVTAPCVPLEALHGNSLSCLTERGVVRVQVKPSLCDEMFIALESGPQPGTTVVLGEGDP